MKLAWIVCGVALVLAFSACKKQHKVLRCDACLDREGQVTCGRSEFDLSKQGQKPVTEDEAKLQAGKAACIEIAARKGGGYAGPPYQKALDECQAKVAPKDLIRVHCDESVYEMNWNPNEGI